MKQLISLLLISLFFCSCSKEESITDNNENRFFLKNNDAIMPVVVKGNTNAKVLMIVLHGGPGDSGIRDFADNGVFKNLEDEYAMVYFDQRCAGLSQGNCDPNTLEVSDFVEDIDKLVLLLESIFGEDVTLFLLGHSWGATLGLDYLVHGEQKNKIKGYVHTNGSHNIPMLIKEQKDLILHYANQQIGLNNNVEKWQNILDKISDADPTVKEDRITITINAYQTEQLFESVDSIKSPTLMFSFGSYLSGIFPIILSSNINHEFTTELLEYDITNELSRVTTPVGILWGKFDLVHPPNMAKDIYQNIGTSEKELFFFSKSFHSPMANENELYQSKVKEFLERYR